MGDQSFVGRSLPDGSYEASEGTRWTELDPPGTFREVRHDATAALFHAALIGRSDPEGAQAAIDAARARVTEAGLSLEGIVPAARRLVGKLRDRGDLSPTEAARADDILRRAARG
jgi:hypothetical protein